MTVVTDGYDTAMLPRGLRSNFRDGVNGLRIHYLEAGFEVPDRPLLMLLHGFPELAYSWRKVMPSLAAAGYHVVAPDMRGYGRTTGWPQGYDVDLRGFGMLNIARDVIGLIFALGHNRAAGLIGHDFGAPAAAWAALVRQDLFGKLVLMSAPFGGAPVPPEARAGSEPGLLQINAELNRLDPPRNHYQCYYSTLGANANMSGCPQGLHAFLRAYYHVKSADWKGNRPHRLDCWTAAELAKLPRYYVMDAGVGMAETALPEAPGVTCAWLPDRELAVYAAEYQRTGFQGALNWYRCSVDGVDSAALELFGRKQITIPSLFLSGAADWGTYQRPHFLEKMQTDVCIDMRGVHLLEGAGHWVQQERPEDTVRHILDFMASA